mmetsp:Transcript_27488/g.66757  ORF Transcript_27488/g.66757 Transcript_27488/m.66757 type:complete len:285 (+) Transcript_27488:726-1580(+)
MEGLFARNDGSIRSQHEMNSGVGHQSGLEIIQIDIEGTFETKTSSQSRSDLSNESVQVLVRRTFNVQVATADIVKSLVIQAKSTVGMLQKGMSRQDRVVWFYNSSRNLRRRRDSKGKLGLAAIVYRETFQQQGSKTRSSTSTSSVKDQETLKTSTVVSQLADTIQDGINNFLSNGVMTTGVVIGSVFLSRDNGFWVVERSELARANFVTNSGFQIDIDGTRNVLARGSLGKESVERIIGNTNRSIRGHHTIWVNAVLEAVEFPARVTGLDTGLTEVDGDDFTHD